jgi:hypothetical protein
MNYTSKEEVEHRRLLLRLAAKGNAQARKELEQEYHARVFSAAQVAKYVPKFERATLSATIQRKFDRLFDIDDDAA